MGHEFLTVYWREMIRFVRFRGQLFASLVQPALWLLLFGVAMTSNFDSMASGTPAPPGVISIDYLTFMTAGVIAMTALFTSLFGGLSLLFDKNWGIMREMLASPMPRHHIQIGVGLGGVTKTFIQVMLIMVFGMLIGVSFFPGYSAIEVLVGVLGILAFVGMFALGFLFLSATISMRMESMESVQAMMTLLTLPLFFSSNALYPVNNFPVWLQAISTVNPLTYLVNGVRYFAIGSDFVSLGTEYAYSTNDILISFGALVAFAVIMFLTAYHTFNKATIA